MQPIKIPPLETFKPGIYVKRNEKGEVEAQQDCRTEREAKIFHFAGFTERVGDNPALTAVERENRVREAYERKRADAIYARDEALMKQAFGEADKETPEEVLDIPDAPPVQEEFVAPDKPLQDWNKDQLEAYGKTIGLTISQEDNTKKQMVDLIEAHLNKGTDTSSNEGEGESNQ